MRASPTTDTEPNAATALVLLARRGDRTAFGGLYRLFARVVHGILLARCGRDAVDDLTQEVFMNAFERLADLRDAAAFPGWLCTAARNTAADHLRRRRQLPDARELPDVIDHAVPPDDALASSETAARVLQIVATLPDTYRETLVLRLVEGLTGPEIAQRTGMTHGSVRVNLTRGMAMLRPLLEGVLPS